MRNNITKNQFIDTQTIVIREMDETHLEQIALLEKECFFDEAWSYELIKAELEDKFKHYFVAEEKNIVLAYGGYAQIVDEAHIMNIAVRKESRKNGLASKILDKMLQDAIEKNIKRATLEVMDTNLGAVALYEKFGFIYAGKRKNYYRNTHDAVTYWK
ncbi:MAG: ribosomal protein S18-alanine N-acetyltransferase, partial [Bacillota bacterium]